MTVHRTTVAAMLGGALLLALAPRTATAQWRSDTERAMRASVALAPATVQTPAPVPAFQGAQARHRGRGPATLLMIVGGAALVVGVVADETLLVFGGFGVAMYGGYLYLR